jgi:hypothetical protein
MNESGLTVFCCVVPLLWTGLVFWAGKGFPGWPWKVSVARRGATANYYQDEEE